MVDNSGQLSLFIAGDDGIEQQAVCYTPVGVYVPQHLHECLPKWFLKCAVLEDYVTESCLLACSRQQFEKSIVHPGMRNTNSVQYRAVS